MFIVLNRIDGVVGLVAGDAFWGGDLFDGDGDVFVEYGFLECCERGGIYHHVRRVDVDFHVAAFESLDFGGEIVGEEDEGIGFARHDGLDAFFESVDASFDAEALCRIDAEHHIAAVCRVVGIEDDGGPLDDRLVGIGQRHEERVGNGQHYRYK